MPADFPKGAGKINRGKINRIWHSLASDSLVVDLSVGEQQRVNIALFAARAALLIMDELTPVLTPQETRSCLMFTNWPGKVAGIAHLHKLDEIKQLTSRATILRGGEKIASKDTGQINQTIGRIDGWPKISAITPPEARNNAPAILHIKGLNRPAAGHLIPLCRI